MRFKLNSTSIQLALIFIIRWFIYVYIILRFVFFYLSEYSLSLKALASIFVFAEMFVLVHALAYLRNLHNVLSQPDLPPISVSHEPLKEYPSVALVVASYKEPLKIIEETLLCLNNLFYPNKTVYLLDDTRYDQPWADEDTRERYKNSVERLCKWLGVNLFRRKWHHAKAGIIDDFLKFAKGESNPDYRMLYYDAKQEHPAEKYLVIFDADMNPVPDFAEPLVKMLEENSNLAFVQTPQYYTNFSTNKVARAASLMQVIFYEYICESKGIDDMMLLCGTNVMIRIEALNSVGGFDLDSVTEDFATALKLHLKGWISKYVNRVTAFGMGPEDLGSFYTQQFRWALGTIGLLPEIIKIWVAHPFRYRWRMMYEYFISSSYYLIGWMYFILMMGPASYLFFDLPIYIMPPMIYFAVLVPYNILINILFFWCHIKRGYLVSDLFSGIILGILSSHVYMKASVLGLLGIKGKFHVTSKEGVHSLPFKDLLPIVFMALICFSTFLYGALRLIYEGDPVVGISVNMFWIMYYFLIFSSIFYYNNPAEISKPTYPKI